MQVSALRLLDEASGTHHTIQPALETQNKQLRMRRPAAALNIGCFRKKKAIQPIERKSLTTLSYQSCFTTMSLDASDCRLLLLRDGSVTSRIAQRVQQTREATTNLSHRRTNNALCETGYSRHQITRILSSRLQLMDSGVQLWKRRVAQLADCQRH